MPSIARRKASSSWVSSVPTSSPARLPFVHRQPSLCAASLFARVVELLLPANLTRPVIATAFRIRQLLAALLHALTVASARRGECRRALEIKPGLPLRPPRTRILPARTASLYSRAVELLHAILPTAAPLCGRNADWWPTTAPRIRQDRIELWCRNTVRCATIAPRQTRLAWVAVGRPARLARHGGPHNDQARHS